MRSLVLVGHGSHTSGDFAGPTYRFAEALRERGAFGEVVEAFWKEDPALRRVLRTTASTHVTVIPLFASEGYLTETVIPRELGLGHQGPVPEHGVARVLGGRTVRYTRPYGVHPAMTDVILARAAEVLPQTEWASAALVVLGSGGAAPHSGDRVTEAHAARLRERGLFQEVHALSADALSADEWPQVVQARKVVLVPFSGQAVPLPASPESARQVYRAEPAGTHPGVVDVLLRLAGEAADTEQTGGDLDRAHQAAWAAALELTRQPARIGEVLVTPQGRLLELRHALDEGLPGTELQTLVTPEGLRDHLRVDQRGQHRPVRTYRTLRRGWRGVIHESEWRRVLHDLYPAVTEEAYAHGCYTLRPTPWPTTARRQTGRDARVQRATPDLVERVSREVCAPCMKTRLWAGEKLPLTFLDGVPGAMPCAEACTVLIARVREELPSPGGAAEETGATVQDR